jgi:hypothetical protein
MGTLREGLKPEGGGAAGGSKRSAKAWRRRMAARARMGATKAEMQKIDRSGHAQMPERGFSAALDDRGVSLKSTKKTMQNQQ